MMLVTFIRSTVFNLFLYTWSVLLCGLASPGLLFFGRNYASKITHMWACGIMVVLKYVCGLKFRVLGHENLPQEPFIVACKHQSAWETIFPLMYFKNVVYVLKKEVTYIPMLGWYPKPSGMIVIDRSKKIGALITMLKRIGDVLKQRRVIVIFPEGTRVKPLAKIPYKVGIAAIYAKYGKECPIVPAALNSGVYWGKNAWLKHSGTITIHFLPPLSPNLSKKAMLSELQDQLETYSNILVNEARTEMDLGNKPG
ncbi:1-acyl-sn-glycerol-3-phosphate acyltransferase [Alphaproteobacteria bacterium]